MIIKVRLDISPHSDLLFNDVGGPGKEAGIKLYIGWGMSIYGSSNGSRITVGWINLFIW